MPHLSPAPAARRPSVIRLLPVLLLATALAVVGCRSSVVTRPDAGGVERPGAARPHGMPGPDDGELPDGVTAFDDDFPAVSRLDPALLDALRRASTAAAGDGIEVQVNSGWRSPAYQARLLDEAVATYGSRAEAARWVATPATSPHVSGDAVDVASDGARWLGEHGAAYGLCRVYANEPWHFELRPPAVDDGCPPTYADPTADPRMQR